MNVLIVGGLLAVGVVAILGAILLGMSEQRAETRRNAQTSQPASIENKTPITNSQSVVTGKLVEDSLPSKTTIPAENALVRHEEASFPVLNGQFHELAGEIRTLHEQAWQLEQRLSVLTKMVDHIEHSQDRHVNIEEEEASTTSDPTLM